MRTLDDILIPPAGRGINDFEWECYQIALGIIAHGLDGDYIWGDAHWRTLTGEQQNGVTVAFIAMATNIVTAAAAAGVPAIAFDATNVSDDRLPVLDAVLAAVGHAAAGDNTAATEAVAAGGPNLTAMAACVVETMLIQAAGGRQQALTAVRRAALTCTRRR